MKEFEANLVRPEGVGTWTYLTIPFSVEEAYRQKSQVKVKGTINGVPYRSSLMPHGDGRHYMVVKKEIREMAGATAGDTVRVTMELDEAVREVTVPDDFTAALEADEAAKANFDTMAYSYRKEYVMWIESAKREETRRNRIQKAVDMLREGKKLK